MGANKPGVIVIVMPATEQPQQTLAPLDHIEMRGMRLDRLSLQQAVTRILDSLDAGRGGWLVTPNLDILRQTTKDPELRAMLNRADLIVADGMPLIWASRLSGKALPERVAGSSMILPLSEQAAKAGRRVYLLGGNPGVADECGQLLKQQCPGLVIAGTSCPPVGFEKDDAYMDDLKEAIDKAKPDLVYVALGAPKQEKVIQMLRDAAPDAWWLGIGISLSFLTGDVQRAPRWMQKTGLEWVHRLCHEPKRLAKRYLVDGLPFAASILIGGLIGRFRGARESEPEAC